MHSPLSIVPQPRSVDQALDTPVNGAAVSGPAPNGVAAMAPAHAANVESLSKTTLDTYAFPHSRLKPVMADAARTPVCLVACGSFSPITYLHLRMFEMAADYAKFHTDFEVVGGYLSPVSDAYKKAGLASAEHRYVVAHPTRRTY